ncbi:MAG: RDD family protein [Bacteroidota bacterium]
MNTITIPTTQHIDLEYPVASLGDRIVAGIIDLIIQAGYVIFLIYIAEWEVSSIADMWIFLPAMLYSLICEAIFNGQTPGKMVMKTRTISLDGSRPGFTALFLRWGLRVIDIWSLGIFPGLVAIIVISISKKGQRLGDLVATTNVIKLKLVTTFLDTIYVETSDDYNASFPEITSLNDRDISILKEVLDAALKNKNPVLMGKLADRVQQVAGIQTRMPAEQFLQTVLADYNHYYGK